MNQSADMKKATQMMQNPVIANKAKQMMQMMMASDPEAVKQLFGDLKVEPKMSKEERRLAKKEAKRALKKSKKPVEPASPMVGVETIPPVIEEPAEPIVHDCEDDICMMP